MIEHISGALMMYLMIEHNDEQYVNVLMILNKCKLYYCIDQRHHEEEEENEHQEMDSMELHVNHTVDTKTIHVVPMDHVIDTNENSIASSI